MWVCLMSGSPEELPYTGGCLCVYAEWNGSPEELPYYLGLLTIVFVWSVQSAGTGWRV